MAELENVDLTDLHALAEDYADALARVNAPLPDAFPADQMREVTRALLTLDGSPTEDDQRTLVYARSKLREARRVLRTHAHDPEAVPSYFEIERAHNALYVELDVLVEAIPAPILLELQPSFTDGQLVVRRTELTGKVAALERRVSAVEIQSRDALARIGQQRTVQSLIYIESVQLHLNSLIKVVATFSAELKASLIDLPWVTELATRIGEISRGLSHALDTARKGAGQLLGILASAGQAQRLAERLVAGGKALLGWVRRKLRSAAPGNLKPSQAFRDINAPWCPQMVVMPPGTFLMGTPEDEDDREENEGPLHRVSFGQPFAVGRYPVTIEEYGHFAESTGRQHPDAQWAGRGRLPVVDAKHYVSWLGEQTGRYYRLLSEAEWEYVCRAGTTTRHWWGNEISPYYGEVFGSRAAVGTYAENPWGLELGSGLFEWVEDCWNDSYEGAPMDGSAWRDGNCDDRVLRGGSWTVNLGMLRSSSRSRKDADFRGTEVGFRVARTLS